jgi:hypothetical protein
MLTCAHVDGVDELSLEGADGLFLALALGDLALDVVLGGSF